MQQNIFGKLHLTNNIKYSLFFLLFLFSSIQVSGQNWSVDPGVFLGKIWIHKSELRYKVPPISHGTTFAINYQTAGKTGWERYWSRPQVAIDFMYLNFGDRDVLGSAFALMPGIKLKIKEKQNWRLYVHLGVGIAYLTRVFDALENPDNNAISTHLNNATKLRFGNTFRLSDRLALEAGLNLIHFSNGLTKTPNAGINTPGLDLRIQYRFAAQEERSEAKVLSIHEPYRKWRWNIQFGYASKEVNVPQKPNHPVYVFSGAIAFQYNPYNRTMAGLELEISRAEFFFRKYHFGDEQRANEASKRRILFLAQEVFFGMVSLRGQLGFYVSGVNYPEPFYFKFNTLVYSKNLANDHLRLYAGFMLKSHFAVADYIGVVVGVDM